MRAGTAALVTGGVVLLLAGFIAIGAFAGLMPLYAGFLLLWYFASIDMLDTAALPALAIGALGGTGTAWALQLAAAHGSAPGVIAVLAMIVLAVFAQLMGWLPLLINRAYMLYVTVMAAPLLQAQERFDQLALTILAATVYFGGIVWVGRRVIAARAKA